MTKRIPSFTPQKEADMVINWGSKLHKELTKKVELAQSKGWEPRWYYNGQNYLIVDLQRINPKQFKVYLKL